MIFLVVGCPLCITVEYLIGFRAAGIGTLDGLPIVYTRCMQVESSLISKSRLASFFKATKRPGIFTAMLFVSFLGLALAVDQVLAHSFLLVETLIAAELLVWTIVGVSFYRAHAAGLNDCF
jgi:hypothetical protein